MASISPLIVTQNQSAAPASAKTGHSGKQNQNNTASFGDLLSQTLTSADGASEKTAIKTTAKTAGKPLKIDTHRSKASGRKEEGEAASAAISAQISVTPDDLTASLTADKTRLRPAAGTADSEKPQAHLPNAAPAGSTARAASTAHAASAAHIDSTDAVATSQAAGTDHETAVEDSQTVASAVPSRPQHGRATFEVSGAGATDAAATGTGLKQTAESLPASPAAEVTGPQIKRSGAQVAMQTTTVQQPQDRNVARPTMDAARRPTEGTALNSRPEQANVSAGKTTAAAPAGNLTPAAPVFGAMAQESVQSASTAQAPANMFLAPRVASDEWNNALGNQMVWMTKANQQLAELHLNPPHLGPLKVTLIMQDSQAQAMFTSPHQSVLAAVESALPQLRTTLAENGISLGNASVSPEGQHPGMMARDQSGQSGQPDRRGYAGNDEGIVQTADVITPAAPVITLSNGGAIDTFV